MPLNRQQRNELRSILQKRHDALLAEIEVDRTKAGMPQAQAGSEERLAALQDTGIADAELERDRSEFEDVRQALLRVNDEDYGTCAGCGRPIPWKRLLGSPAARRCLECQAAFERRTSPP
jgi:DnaK suppressor protein